MQIKKLKFTRVRNTGKDQQNLIENISNFSLNNRMAYQLKEKFTHSLPQI